MLSTRLCADVRRYPPVSFPFTSGAPGKVRPALLLFDLNDDAIICRVTSILYDGQLDVVLNDWASAVYLNLQSLDWTASLQLKRLFS